MLAGRANISRSALVRSVLAEYVEIKLGPRVREAVAAWTKHGEDVLQAFVREHIGIAPEVAVGRDPGFEPKYMEEEQDNAPPTANEQNIGERSKVEPIGDSLTKDFATQKEVSAPTPTESEYVAADPDRRFRPLPEHFPVETEIAVPREEIDISPRPTILDEPFEL